MTISRAHDRHPHARPHPLRVALASFIGTAIEWYDYFIYGMAAGIVFNKLFFPSISPAAGTLAAFATFSIGFLARPLGGIVMGHFGDRVGRKSMLVISLLTMGLATVGIGLLPGYDTIGVAAPVLLVVLRFVQGIGVGGEWSGAVLMAVEHAPPGRRDFYGSFPQMGVPGGLLLANAVFLTVSSTLSAEQFLAWGWRIPFLGSAVMVIVGLAIRFSVTESPAFEEVRARGARAKLPILVVVRQHLREVLLAAGAFIANNTLGYILIAYGLSYATTALKMPRDTVLVLTLTASAVWLLCVPLASILSDRIGRTRVLLVGSVGQAAWAAVLFPLIDTASPGLVLLALCGAAVFLGIVYGPMAALFSDLFSPEVRYSGTSLAYQLGAILGGGLAPTVSASLYAAYGSSTPITVYLVATGLVSLGCMYAATRRPV